jgi:hypothetical protein
MASFFFCDFFLLRCYFRYLSEKDRNTQILKKKMENRTCWRFFFSMVMYVTRLDGNCVQVCRLLFYRAIPSFFAKRAGIWEVRLLVLLGSINIQFEIYFSITKFTKNRDCNLAIR